MKITSQAELHLQVEALPARAVELLGVESRLYCFEEWGTDQVILRSAALMTLLTSQSHVTQASSPCDLRAGCTTASL